MIAPGNSGDGFWGDDDDDERRTPAQFLFDTALLPGVVLLLTALTFFAASLTIYGILAVWSLICGLVG